MDTIIRTYSRRQPVTTFKSAATLVPSYPDFDAVAGVRESRLQDKTLLVNAFEDTFDRLATGVKVKSPRKLEYRNSSRDDIDDFFQTKPQGNSNKRILRRNYKDERQKTSNDNSINDKNKPKEKKKTKTAISSRTGVKRKIANDKNNSYSSKNESFVDNVTPLEPAKKSRKILDRNENASVGNEIQLNTNYNKDENGFVNDKINKNKTFLNRIKESHELYNPCQLKDIGNLLTSTPREHKLQSIMNMQDLSPITLDNNTNRNERDTRVQFIKSRDDKLEDNVGTNTRKLNKEESVFKNAKTPENNNKFKRISIMQPLIEKKSSNTSILKHTKKNNTVSFNDSPLIFDNTEYDQDQNDEDKSHVFENICKSFASELIDISMENKKKRIDSFNFNRESANNETENFNSIKSDSIFSLHDWTNEYNSSYEYLTTAEKIKQKSLLNLKNDENLQKSLYNQSSSLNKRNELSVLLNTNFEQQVNYDSVIVKTEDIVPNGNKINTTNDVSENDKIINNDTLYNFGSTLGKEECFIENANYEELPNISFNDVEVIKTEMCEITKSEEFINGNFNEENVQKNFSNNVYKLNGPELILCITKLDDQNLQNIPSVKSKNINKGSLKQSKINKKQNNLENVEKINTLTGHNVTNGPNSSIGYQEKKNLFSKLNGDELVLCISKIDENINNKSPILSRKNPKKNIIRKSIQKSKNVDNIKVRIKHNNVENIKLRVKQKNIVNNKGNISFEANKEKTDLNQISKQVTSANIKNSNAKEQSDQLIDKELRVLVSKLEYQEKKPSTPTNKYSKRKSRKSELKTDKNIKKINEENILIENDKTAQTNNDNIKNPKSDIIINKNNSISENKNTEVNVEDKILSKLNNSARITKRRNKFEKWSRPLTAITEAQMEESVNIIYDKNKTNEKSTSLNVQETIRENISLEVDKTNKSMDDNFRRLSIVLKPGKFWARSLSIINNFHNVQNLDDFAIGRGKNWRHSVQTILDMQPEGVVQRAIKTKDEEKDSISDSIVNLNDIQLDGNRFSYINNSPRFSRRFSIRIVPSGKKSSLMDDSLNTLRNSHVSNRTRKTSSARKTSLKTQSDNLIETEDDLIRTAKSIILKRCNQTSYLPFNVCFSNSYLNYCSKIGEGVYGEVFLYENNNEKSVIKIIPIEGKELVNYEPQKKFHEILSEIIISQELHKLRFGNKFKTSGFIGVKRIMCIIGKYPDKLIKLWKKFDQEKKSENDCPSMFNDQQLYIVLELAHGGQDLEAFVFQNASQCYSVFVQTAFALAVAEKSLEFEHRDLHWGNLLISKTDDTNVTLKLDNAEITIPTSGVKISVIDFTLSRMSYQGCKIFNDLATDPTLFTAQGEYQFDIYRMMRDNVNNDWQQFKPYTNILWLDYVLEKMITAIRYRKKTTKIHKSSMLRLQKLRKVLLNYNSAFDFVKNCQNILDIIQINGNFT